MKDEEAERISRSEEAEMLHAYWNPARQDEPREEVVEGLDGLVPATVLDPKEELFRLLHLNDDLDPFAEEIGSPDVRSPGCR